MPEVFPNSHSEICNINKKCYGSLRAVDKIKYGNYTDLEMTEIESGKAITTKK